MKRIWSTLSESRFVLKFETVSPATVNVLLEGAEVAGMAKNLWGSFANLGNLSAFICHQSSGLLILITSLMYSLSSSAADAAVL